MNKIEKDIELTCVECNGTFKFTTGEQCYFFTKGLAQPKRCPECRATRKEILRLSKEVFHND